MEKVVLPYQESELGKKQQVEQMFDNIAPRYDFLNHFLSLGIDKIWRKKMVGLLRHEIPKNILDVATGTGDVALGLASLKPEKITGIDLSAEMLQIGRKKIQERGLDKLISLQQGDSEHLPFGDHSFDAVTVAFGVRNFENLQAGIREIHRVLKPGGRLVVLEFSKPKTFPVSTLFRVYFRFILPVIGKLFTKDKRAYTYLPESVQAFPEGKGFVRILEQNGFSELTCKALSFGVSTLYSGRK